MSEIINFKTRKSQEIVDHTYKERALNTLKDITERVESGEILGFIIVSDHQGNTGSGWVTGSGANLFSLLGGLDIVKRDFMYEEIE